MDRPRKKPSISAIPTSPGPSPYRRSRTIWFFVFVALLCFFFVPWELPESLKDSGISTLSRANIAQLVRPSRYAKQPEEIYGLLHLVTSDDQKILSHSVDMHPDRPLDMKVYAGGEIDWEKDTREIKEKYPVVVFSKTYCPFSRKAKSLLETYNLSPPPKIVEVDLRDDGDLLKALLKRLTGRATFPNIIVHGKTIGGSDDVHALHADGKLRRVFEKAGVQVRFDMDE